MICYIVENTDSFSHIVFFTLACEFKTCVTQFCSGSFYVLFYLFVTALHFYFTTMFINTLC